MGKQDDVPVIVGDHREQAGLEVKRAEGLKFAPFHRNFRSISQKSYSRLNTEEF